MKKKEEIKEKQKKEDQKLSVVIPTNISNKNMNNSNQNNNNLNNNLTNVDDSSKRVVNNNNTNNNQNINNTLGNNKENKDSKIDENTLREGGKDEKGNETIKCPNCHSASIIDSKIRLNSTKKKINPCLVDPQEIKHTLICCNHSNLQKLSVDELDPKNYRMLPPCLLNNIPAAGKANKMSEPVSILFK